jgi:acetamidase/formamidase
MPLLALAAALLSSLTAVAETHEVKLIPRNVHWGYYSRGLQPILRIAPGDTVRVETMVAGGLERLRIAGVPDAEIPDSLKEVERAVTDRGPGVHPLTGPIYVEGAAPGDTLEIRIVGFEYLHPYGVSGFVPTGGSLPDDFPYDHFKLFRFDTAAGTASFRPGVVLPLAPFFGSIGVALNVPARIPSGPPGAHTGNIDNKHLVAGTTLYVPVHVPGAMLSMGDAHAMQGDGEVSLTAVETSVRGTVEVHLRKGERLRWPRAETPTHFITMGLHPDLDEAARMATREMIDYLVSAKGIPREEAYILISVAVDLHVTQLVDGTKGIHAMLAKSLFR